MESITSFMKLTTLRANQRKKIDPQIIFEGHNILSYIAREVLNQPPTKDPDSLNGESTRDEFSSMLDNKVSMGSRRTWQDNLRDRSHRFQVGV
jgi:hypothetical protein